MGSRAMGRTGVLLLACAIVALFAAPAKAVTITLGPEDLSPADPFATCGLPPACQTKVYVPTVAPGATLVTPADGTITEWRVKGAPPNRLFLRVVRDAGGGQFQGVGRSGKAKESSGIGFTPAAIGIKAGDQLGVELETNFPTADPSTTLLGDATAPGAAWSGFAAGLADGATAAPTETGAGTLPLFNATVVLDKPQINLMSSTQGSQSGGDAVVLTGQHLAVLQGVKFGSTPAAQVIKADNNQVIAVAPPHAPGVVEVTVETAGGSSTDSTADLYTYVVDAPPKPGPNQAPKLWAMKLAPRAFKAARRGPSARAAAATGTRVTYKSSEAARTKFKVKRRSKGRWVRERGSFTRKTAAGANAFRFMGRLRGKALRPGRYQLIAQATDTQRKRGKAVRRTFRIVR